jgi:hypothetical protein
MTMLCRNRDPALRDLRHHTRTGNKRMQLRFRSRPRARQQLVRPRHRCFSSAQHLLLGHQHLLIEKSMMLTRGDNPGRSAGHNPSSSDPAGTTTLASGPCWGRNDRDQVVKT